MAQVLMVSDGYEFVRLSAIGMRLVNEFQRHYPHLCKPAEQPNFRYIRLGSPIENLELERLVADVRSRDGEPDLVTQARNASRGAVDCLRTIEKLQAIGFTDDAFRHLHHQCARMGSFCRYSENKRFKYEGNNHRVHQRLMYVLLSCPDGVPPKGKSFQTLADEAYKLIPPSA